MTELLDVSDLQTEFRAGKTTATVVDKVSFHVSEGEVLALVGESGCGKSVTALSIMGLLPRQSASVTHGSIHFGNRDIVHVGASEYRSLRGREIAIISQDPMASLNPVMTIGQQISEPLQIHLKFTKKKAAARAIELLSLVGIPSPAKRLNDYPHQLSGGMRQRVMIAMALACSPKLILADEITTALDVTIQAQVLELLKKIAKDLNTACVLITHDLGVVAGMAQRVHVMYGGRIVEKARTDELFANPMMPYTWGLLQSIPRVDQDRKAKLEAIEGFPPNLQAPPKGCRFEPRCKYRRDICKLAEPQLLPVAGSEHEARCWGTQNVPEGGWLLELAKARNAAAVGGPSTFTDGRDPRTSSEDRASQTGEGALVKTRDLHVEYGIGGRLLGGARALLRAVDGVDLTIRKGETLGLVGESGCGKSTLGRAILQLTTPTSGTVQYDGIELTELAPSAMRGMRRRMQMIFQDPYASLNPRMKVREILGEPFVIHGLDDKGSIDDRVAELLRKVGLDPDFSSRYPHEFSGGQRQRIGIARALAVGPELIVADEAVSALDVSIQAQVINLLEELQASLDLTYLFIAHDLAVVKHIADRVAVMYLGRIVEIGISDDLYRRPLHPYTTALLSAVPVPDPKYEETRRRLLLKGEAPSPLAIPTGCRFRTRCWKAQSVCAEVDPVLREHEHAHSAACHFPNV